MKNRPAAWLKLETRMMLNLIRDNNLLTNSLADDGVIQELLKLMAVRGYKRTPAEVELKLKSLEQAYFMCRKRGYDDVGLKQFTHYNILHELFSQKRIKELGNDEHDHSGSASDCPEEDSNIWLAQEIQKMLTIIEENDLFAELANGFSLYALKVICSEFERVGFNKDIDQVETALMSLKMSYIKAEEALKDDKETELCPYFDYLKKLWGEEIEARNQSINENISNESIDDETNNKSNNNINNDSVDENVSIENISTEFINENITNELVDENHKNESINDEVNNKSTLKNVKMERFDVDDDGNHKYIDNDDENSSNEQQSSEKETSLAANDEKNKDKCESPKDNEETPTKNGETDVKLNFHFELPPRPWNENETLALLSSIEKTGVFKEFITNLTRSTAKKLVEPLENQGYKRSTAEVLVKLKGLRETYLKSVLNGPNNKINDNQKVILEIDNMIVGTRVDVADEALKSFGDCKNNRGSDGDHNYVSNGTKGERVINESSTASADDVGDHDDDCLVDAEISVSKQKKCENNNDFNQDKNSTNCNNEKSQNNNNISANHINNGKFKTNNKLLLGSWMNLPPTTSTISSTSTTKRKSDSDQNIETNSLVTGQSNADFMTIMNSPMPPKLIKIVKNNDPAIIVAERVSSSQPGYRLISQTLTTTAPSKTIPLNTESSQKNPSKPQIAPRLSTVHEKGVKCLPATSIPIAVSTEFPKATLDTIFRHEKEMQRQHHQWMEKQFELQRKHDRYQREILLTELRQIKQIFMKVYLSKNTR